ncbi:MAG: histidine kinase [Bacteroidota bacterium]
MYLSSTRLLNLWLFLLSGFLSFGQDVVLPLQNISAETGLTSSTFNLYISRDGDHYTWISSITGLNRFDGLRNRQYLAEDSLPNALADPIIQSPMFVDTEGNLWFNTSTAVQKYSPQSGEFQKINIEYNSVEHSDFLLIDLDTSRNVLLFLGQYGKLGKFYPLFEKEITEEYKEPVLIDSIPTYNFNALRKINGPSGDSYNLFIPQVGGWEVREYKGGKRKEIYPFLNQDNKNREPNTSYYDGECLWIGSAAGLTKATSLGNTLLRLDKFKGLTSLNITGIAPYKENILLVSIDKKGLFLFDTRQNRFVRKVQVRIDGRTQNFTYRVKGMIVDEEENLWISTESKGVFYTNLRKSRFSAHLIDSDPNIPAYSIKSITVSSDGFIWSSTEDRLILENTQGEKIDEKVLSQLVGDTQSEYEIYSIREDQEGNKWVGSTGGLYLISGNALKPKNVKLISKGFIRSVEELSDGQKFALTLGHGIMALNFGREGYELTEPIRPTQGAILALCEKYDGKIWVSQWRNSLQLLERASDSLVEKASIPFSPFVYAIEESPDSAKIWVATVNGLYWIDNFVETPILHKDTIFSSRFLSANGLVFDEADRMWVSTNTGLVQYSPELVEETDLDGPPPNVFRVFTQSDGLPANEFNFGAFTKTSEGKLAFGSTNGYTIFHPDEILKYPVEAKPTISQILVNNREVTGKEKYGSIQYKGEELEELILEPGERTFTFRFSAMDYGDPQSTQFEYRLRDRNGKLINTGNESFVRYFNLGQGEYIFELYAANSENSWNPKPQRLALQLKPYFYETTWFMALLALIGLGIMYAVYRYRINNERKKHRMAELENAILRIQMNPHFIFNSLSSVRSYMLSRDTKVANKYLVHLSKLMRKILDVAEESEISVGEDLALLTEYIEAEKLRFEDSFTYTIEMGEGFDEDEYMIPTMILQPFVENAIIHGFKKNAQKGILTLSYRQEGEQLICEVRDNGVGRQAAATHKAKGHTSKATEITHRRLQLIRERTRKPASLEIIDLSDQEGGAIGTKVVIRLPIVD